MNESVAKDRGGRRPDAGRLRLGGCPLKDVALTCCGNPHGDVEQRWVGGKRYGWWVTGWWVTVHIVDGSIVHAIAPYEGGGQWFAGLGWLLR